MSKDTARENLIRFAGIPRSSAQFLVDTLSEGRVDELAKATSWQEVRAVRDAVRNEQLEAQQHSEEQ